MQGHNTFPIYLPTGGLLLKVQTKKIVNSNWKCKDIYNFQSVDDVTIVHRMWQKHNFPTASLMHQAYERNEVKTNIKHTSKIPPAVFPAELHLTNCFPKIQTKQELISWLKTAKYFEFGHRG